MFDLRVGTDTDPPLGAYTAPTRPVLEEWLLNGRLTLIDADRRVVGPDTWPLLPADVRQRALEDFDRVVRGRARAAVLYLRP